MPCWPARMWLDRWASITEDATVEKSAHRAAGTNTAEETDLKCVAWALKASAVVAIWRSAAVPERPYVEASVPIIMSKTTRVLRAVAKEAAMLPECPLARHCVRTHRTREWP